MGRKVEQAQQKTSPVGSADWRAADGFTLIEVVAVLAIVAILAAIVVPALPRGTSRARLESYAIEAAALLKFDRNAAIRNRVSIATEIDAPLRVMRSGATGRTVSLPEDVRFDALLAQRCNQRAAGRRLSGARQLAHGRSRSCSDQRAVSGTTGTKASP